MIAVCMVFGWRYDDIQSRSRMIAEWYVQVSVLLFENWDERLSKAIMLYDLAMGDEWNDTFVFFCIDWHCALCCLQQQAETGNQDQPRLDGEWIWLILEWVPWYRNRNFSGSRVLQLFQGGTALSRWNRSLKVEPLIEGGTDRWRWNRSLKVQEFFQGVSALLMGKKKA